MVARPRSPHLAGLDALRGFAAVIVLLFHASGEGFAIQLGALPVGELFHFGYSGLDLFFVLSGFIIVTVHGADIGRPERLASYAFKRLTRIYPVYWVVILAYILLAVATRTPYDPLRAINSFFLVPISDPVIAVAWTLPHELLFYAVFGLVILSPVTGKIIAGIWLLGSLLCVASDNAVLDFIFNFRHLEFLVGAAAAVAIRHGAVRRPFMVMLAGAFIFAVTAVIDVIEGPALLAQAYIVAYGLAGGAIILGLVRAELDGRLAVPGFVRLLGASSYSIYLTHLMIFSVVSRIAARTHLPSLMPLPAVFFLVAAVMVALGIVFHLAVERPLLQLCRQAAFRTVARTN